MKTTASGFEYEIAETVKDDFELVEVIQDYAAGNKLAAPELIRRLLGPAQFAALKEHCRGENGIVSTERMLQEATEILNGENDKDVKN